MTQNNKKECKKENRIKILTTIVSQRSLQCVASNNCDFIELQYAMLFEAWQLYILSCFVCWWSCRDFLFSRRIRKSNIFFSFKNVHRKPPEYHSHVRNSEENSCINFEHHVCSTSIEPHHVKKLVLLHATINADHPRSLVSEDSKM